MYFGDAFPELSPEQRRSFAAAERRLITRLAVIACCSVVVLGITFI